MNLYRTVINLTPNLCFFEKHIAFAHDGTHSAKQMPHRFAVNMFQLLLQFHQMALLDISKQVSSYKPVAE